MSEGRVEKLYSTIRQMTVDFRLRPGERVNEVTLARQLEASRTPLREALNRLAAEGFIDFVGGRGFFCRKLTIEEVTDLYQLRMAIEPFCARAAAENPDPVALSKLSEFLSHTQDSTKWSLEQVVAFDERFHMDIAQMTGNKALIHTLSNINARIRFFRWVDMHSKRQRTQSEHSDILSAIAAGTPDRAFDLMQAHISARRDEIADALKECFSKLFIEPDFIEPKFVEDVSI